MFLKRCFDILLSLVVLMVLTIPLIMLIIMASIDTRLFGLFVQTRVGRYKKSFPIFKIRTLRGANKMPSSFGKFLRNSKIDELPQFVNILLGHMSVIGPRPDLEEALNSLKEEEAVIFSMRPGLTSLASLKYFNEEEILNKHTNPESYYQNCIWPDKVALNKFYVEKWSLKLDFIILYKTIKRIIKH